MPHETFSQFQVKSILDLDSSKIVDIIALTSNPLVKTLPILLVEIDKTSVNEPRVHEDFSTLYGLLTASCARQAEALQSIGLDPMSARAFGIRIRGTTFQLAVAHPVFDSQDGISEFVI